MSTTSTPLTAEQLLALPQAGQRHELICGELRTMSPTGFEHGLIVARVTKSLMIHVDARNFGHVLVGDAGFVVARDPDTVLAPDVAFVIRERIAGKPPGFFEGAPDLVVEVISPSDLYTEVEDKVARWLDAGCRMVITVNPRRETATISRSRTDITQLQKHDHLEGGDVVPGWQMPVAELFA